MRRRARPPRRCRMGVVALGILGASAACGGPGDDMERIAGRRYYFGSWTGYQPPVKPRDPMEYEVAEGRPAFSVFVFDGDGRVQWFEKWLASAVPADPEVLAGRELEPGRRFFAPSSSDPSMPGEEISLEGTRPLSVYFRATVDVGGDPATVERVERERTIRHEYEYWENGAIREFRYEPGTGPGGVDRYDRDGELVSAGP